MSVLDPRDRVLRSGALRTTRDDDGLLSPELALVCPELAARARAALPDRPWEAVAPAPFPLHGERPAAAGRAVAPVADARSEAATPVILVPAPHPAASTAATATATATAAAPAPVAKRRAPRQVLRAALAPAAIALVFAAVVWASEQTAGPTFVDSPSQVETPRPGAETVQPAEPPPVQQPASPPEDPASGVDRSSGSSGERGPDEASPSTRRGDDAVTGATRPSTPDARPATSGAESTGAGSRAVRPFPQGGYVFEGGVIVADATGRSVRVLLNAGCGDGARTPLIPLRDGQFRYAGGSVERAGTLALTLTGRFVDRRTVRLELTARGPGCRGTRVVVARLS